MIWKVYFWILLILEIFDVFSGATFGWVLHLVDIIFIAIALLGLFAYSWGKYFWPPLFWKLFSVLFIAEQLYYSLNFYFLNDAGKMTAAITGIIALPIYIILFLYAFKVLPEEERLEDEVNKELFKSS